MKTGPGRACYLGKRHEGKTRREALRCLKRQLIKAVWRAMARDRQRQTAMIAATCKHRGTRKSSMGALTRGGSAFAATVLADETEGGPHAFVTSIEALA